MKSDQKRKSTQFCDEPNNTWTTGPEFPVNVERKGAGVAATVVGHQIYANGFGGGLYKLDTVNKSWKEAKFELEESRVYHRLIAFKDEMILFVGGRARSGPTAKIEFAKISDLEFEEELEQEEFNTQKYLNDFVDSLPGSNIWPSLRGEGNNFSNAQALPLLWSDNNNVA